MAKWKVLQLNIIAESKMHFGNSNLGMIELTHRYIPGKALWGAVTSILTRRKIKEYNPNQYRVMGKLVQEAMCFTNCYIAEGEYVFIPGYTDNGLEYHRIRINGETEHRNTISEYQFEQKYIRSYTSTALIYTTHTSADNSLHEIEYLKPGTRFVGYIFYNSEYLEINGISENELKISITEHLGLQGLGGNRSRGFGKVSIQVNGSWEGEYFSVFFKKYADYQPIELNLTDNPITVQLTQGGHLTILPLMYQALKSVRNFRGNIVPVVSRLWVDNGAGQQISEPIIIMQSGSTFNLQESLKMTLSYEGFLKLGE